MSRLDLFDRVVAENGALLYRPGSKEERVLANPSTERPHVVVVEEAHRVLPNTATSSEMSAEARGFLFVTVRPSAMAPHIVADIDPVLAVSEEPGIVLADFGRIAGLPVPDFTRSLDRGELVTLSRDDPWPRRLHALPVSSAHRRHVRKYAKGDLGEDKSFYFRCPDGRLNLRAPDQTMFVQLGEGVDDAIWDFHRRRGDYSQWISASIKDDSLAREVESVEASDLPSARAKHSIREAVERRYTLPG
jgi:hypothetical protein